MRFDIHTMCTPNSESGEPWMVMYILCNDLVSLDAAQLMNNFKEP